MDEPTVGAADAEDATDVATELRNAASSLADVEPFEMRDPERITVLLHSPLELVVRISDRDGNTEGRIISRRSGGP